MADHPFDEGLLRGTAALVVEDLPVDLADGLITRYGEVSALVDEMAALGRRVWAHLDRRGRTVPHDSYPLFAVAMLSVRSRVGVQQNVANAVKAYDKLLSFGDVPVEVAATARLLDESLAEPLIRATRVVKEVRALRAQPPLFIGMVAAAVVAVRGPDPADLVSDVLGVLDRGDVLAARHRARLEVEPGTDPGFRVMGNVDFVGQIAAYRAAIAELTGVAPVEEAPAEETVVEETVADHAAELAAVLRRAMTVPLRGPEPDVMTGLKAFARFLGGPGGAVAEEVFRRLPHESVPSVDGARHVKHETPVDHDSPALVRADGVPSDEPFVHADHIARWMLVELYSGANPAQREELTAWLTGRRPPDVQDHLAFLVDRVRRVDRRLRGPSGDPPALAERAETAVAFAALRSRVRDALTLGLDGGVLVRSVLPPLWTGRAAAVHLVARKLKPAIGHGPVNVAKASLVASVVVRAPAQQVRRAVDVDRPETCPCGEGPRPVTEVCPHRPWDEAGRVEDYTTLTRFTGFSAESTTRMHLKRYDGPWREWVRELREEEQ